MKKLTLFYLLLFIVIFKTNSQNAFYDANYLKRADTFGGKIILTNDIQILLQNYYPGKTSTEITAVLLEGNPFFKPLFEDKGADAEDKSNFLSSSISSIGGLDITNIADGLAKFLIKRGKEELNIAFFQKLKEFLENPDYPEAKTLFPESVIVLGKIASYRYAELLPTLREAFYKDVNNLIVNLNRLIDLPKYETLLKALPEIRVAVRSSKIISDLTKPDSSMHPANLITRFAELKEWGEMNDNLDNSWKVLNVISNSVRKAPYTVISRFDTTYTTKLKEVFRIEPGTQWIDTIKGKNGYDTLRQVTAGVDTLVKFKTIDTFSVSAKVDTVWNNEVAWIKFSDFEKDILRDSIALKIYLGLLYERMRGLHFRYAANKDTTVQDFMRNNANNIYKIASLTNDFLTLANDVELAIKEIKEKKVNGLTNEDYYTYIEKAINVVEYGFKVANTIKEGVADDRYITIARNGNNLYKNIYTKNYNAAIFNGYSILQEILIKCKSAVEEKNLYYDSLMVATSKLGFNTSDRTSLMINRTGFSRASSSLETDKFYSKEKKKEKLVENILRYGNAMASIVKSENSEEAAAAIEAAALPAGSSSIKKNSQWNISINSYIGGYFGTKYSGDDLIDGNNSTVGVYAPVGIAISKGLGLYPKTKNPIGSVTLYGTLIDVGAIAGFRLSNDSSALEQKVTIDDIFSPGGYLVYGFGIPFFKGMSYIPISIGYGWQYGSKLYFKNSGGKLQVSDQSRWRSNWFIGIDIPLVNLWTRNYKGMGK